MKLFTLILTIGLAFAQEKVVLDRVASVVEDKIVLLSDVVLAANAIAAQQNINPTKNPTLYNNILNQSLESMIEQLLIIEMAEIDSVEVLDKDVDRSLDKQVENIILQTGGKEQAELALGKKISEFKRSYRDDMRGKLLAEKYTSSLTSNISVSRGDVIDFFNVYKDSLPDFPTLYKTRHILVEIKPSDESDKAAEEKALLIKEKILDGMKFEEAAEKFSEDPGSKNNGGNLGFVSRGTFVKEFEKVAFTIDKNILSEPIKTQFGYHIIEVLERSGERVLARHILIRSETTENDKKIAYKKADDIKKKINSYDDFYEQASSFSDDETSKSKGGYMGMIDIKEYQVPEISEVLKTIDINSVSSPILTNFGYHLVWVDEIISGGPATLEKNWLDIEGLALNKKKSDWYNDWIEKIKQNFYIKRNDLTYPQINN